MKAQHASKRAAEKKPITPGGENVFADLGFPEQEAAELKLKSKQS